MAIVPPHPPPPPPPNSQPHSHPHPPSQQSRKSTLAHQSINIVTVNDVVSAVHRKLTISHLDELSPAKSPSPRRTSFNMHSFLHHGKDKEQHKRSDSNDREERRNKRNSLTNGLRSSSKTKDAHHPQSPRFAPVSPGKFEVIIESPPLCFYGTAANSTGALLSGRLQLDVTDPAGEIQLATLVMTLNAAIMTKKPVAKDCLACAKRVNDLKTWKFLSEPKTCHTNENNQFPFSFLFPGHLPATTISNLGSVTYYLEVRATTSHSETIHLTYPLKIERAIPPGLDKSSVRIFPPTNLTSRIIMPPVIHPMGTFPLQMILSGVVEKRAESQTRWRLRKLMWRIDEHTKMVSSPCSKHGHKVGGDGKALQHQDERTVGSDELKTGWKTDFDTQGGEITLELDARLSPSKHLICDVDSPAGLEVRHNLVLELIIAEEFCPNRNTSLITPTGSARVLRMQFAIIVTERAGMGISWDEEMPPVYEDVPASPPGYGRSDKNNGAFGGAIMEDYHGPELEYVDLERLQTDNPNDPPTYRERDPSEYAGGIMAAMMRGGSGSSSMASPALGPASPRARPRRASSSNHSAHVQRSALYGLTEDDFGIEPPEFRMGSTRPESDGSRNGRLEEDFGEGETA